MIHPSRTLHIPLLSLHILVFTPACLPDSKTTRYNAQQEYDHCNYIFFTFINCFSIHLFHNTMMLGSKGILPPMIHGLLRISCSPNPKNIRNPPCSVYFLMFYGSQNHAFSCKHEKHNLLTLISYYNFIIKNLKRQFLDFVNMLLPKTHLSFHHSSPFSNSLITPHASASNFFPLK